MKKVLTIFLILLAIIAVVDYRFGFPNTDIPTVTNKSGESIYSSSLATTPTSFIEYALYDDDRKCFLWGDETFQTFKKDIPVIERDDKCLHCNKAWKWHYNK